MCNTKLSAGNRIFTHFYFYRQDVDIVTMATSTTTAPSSTFRFVDGESISKPQKPFSFPVSPTKSMADKATATLKVHLPNGGFNVVKFGDATDIKVRRQFVKPF